MAGPLYYAAVRAARTARGAGTRIRDRRSSCQLPLAPSSSLLVRRRRRQPSAADESRFMSYPDVRGDRIVFAWDGDLYATGLDGGTAVRLTSHPGLRARAEALARREVDRLHGLQRQRRRRVRDPVGGRDRAAAHLAPARRAGRDVDARQPLRGVPLELRRLAGVARPEALPRGARRRDAGSAARRPRPERELLGGRLADALRAQGQPGLLLEALQGRPVPRHLDVRLRGEELQAGDRLRGPQRLPDVGGRDACTSAPTARPTASPTCGRRTSRRARCGRSRATPTST